MCKIYEVYSGVDLVYATRSESKAYQYAMKSHWAWIVEVHLDTDPAVEILWDTLEEFKGEYL